MSQSIGAIDLQLGVNYDGFNRQIKGIASNAQNMVGGAFKNLGLTIAGAFSAYELYQFGKASISLASDLQEVQNVVDVTFGSMSQQVNNFAKSALNSFGMSELSVKRFAGSLGAMFKSSGIAGQQMTNMSMAMAGLVGDMASFYNLSHEEAFTKIQAGLTGEIMPLKQLGINMSVANIEAYALANGIKKSYEHMNQAEQTLLRYNYLLSVSKDAQGDFARTQGSWANQTRLLSEQFKIFQQTLGAGFINVLTPVVKGLNWLIGKLQVAAAYFKAFTELIFGSAGAVSGAVTPATEGAASGLGDMGSAAGDAGKAAKKAGKDVKGSLSSFDQLNIIGKDAADSLGDAAGGMGGLGGAAGGVDFGKAATGEVDFNIDTSMLDSIKSFLEPLSKISFQPLVKSLGELKTAVTPLVSTLFSGLKWAFDNIFVPLSTWTIEDLLPAFLHALSGGLLVLNPLIQSFQPLFSWLWNNFLVPIAKWTGGTFVAVLNSIGDVLTKIGNWMSANIKTVEKITTVTVAFIAAWKVTEFLAFVQMSGGLVKAVEGITAAIKAGTIAKITDKVETLALTAMYAKDFVAALAASTWAFIANTAQVVIATATQGALTVANALYTVGAWAATAATAALDAALAILTSPITLVIAAIALLVAGVYLLIKHWDDVKLAGERAWAGMKKAWESASTWFSTNVTTPISKAFDNMSTAIGKAFRGAINWVIDGINALIKGMNRISFDVPDWIPEFGGRHFGINIPSVPRLAKGGLATGPTLAMVGDNKNASVDPEVITPLSKLQDMLGASNQAVVEVLMMILNAIENQETNIELDGDKLTNIIRTKLGKEDNRIGQSLVTIGGV